MEYSYEPRRTAVITLPAKRQQTLGSKQYTRTHHHTKIEITIHIDDRNPIRQRSLFLNGNNLFYRLGLQIITNIQISGNRHHGSILLIELI
jgi:hypothetical protein